MRSIDTSVGWTFFLFSGFGLLVGVAVSFFDIRYRRIPNWVILIGLAIAFIWHSFAPPGAWAFDRLNGGAVGLLGSVAAGSLLLVVFLPFWLMRLLGAGDVKLLVLVGATFGNSPGHWSHLPMTILYIAVAGGVLVLASVLLTGRLSLLLSNMKLILMMVLSRAQGVEGPVFDAKTDTAVRLPYGVAIVAGATAFVLSERFF